MFYTKRFTIFKNGSRTYFYSSLFFPKDVRNDVFTLYSFVRIADNFVDSTPQQKKEFYELRKKFSQALTGKSAGDEVIDAFVELIKRKEIPLEWVDAFLNSMEMDITKKKYKNLDEILVYIHGSAEVIGLMMAKILILPRRSYQAAQLLGRAMQYVNFIRDIQEDIQLGRLYFPQSDLSTYRLKSVELLQNKEAIKQFIRSQLQYFFTWQEKAENGYQYIPKRYLIPIKTAADMYIWTARQIYKDPVLVYKKKLKPSVLLILFTLLKNTFR